MPHDLEVIAFDVIETMFSLRPLVPTSLDDVGHREAAADVIGASLAEVVTKLIPAEHFTWT